MSPFLDALAGKITSEDQLQAVLNLYDKEGPESALGRRALVNGHPFYSIVSTIVHYQKTTIDPLLNKITTSYIARSDDHKYAWVMLREILRMDFLRTECKLPVDIRYSCERVPGFGYMNPEGEWFYTESWAKGEKDIQTGIRPGRYIRKIKPHLSDKGVMDLVHDLNDSNFVVKTTWDDAKEWRRVYEDGPHSCMGGKTPESFGLKHTHPVEVYAREENGIGLMWVENSHGRIGARTIVTGNKYYIRIYKSEYLPKAADFLLEHLKAAEYVLNGSALIGRKLNYIEACNGGIICPYIDSAGYEIDIIGDSYLVIRDEGKGEYKPCHSTGRLEGHYYCDHCEEHVSEETTFVDFNDYNVCNYCIDNYYVYAVTNRNGYQEYIPEDDAIQTEDGEWFLNDNNILEANDYREVYGDWIHIDSLSFDEVAEEYVPEGETSECEAGRYQGKWTHDDNIVQTVGGLDVHKEDPDITYTGGSYYTADELQEELDLEEVA